MRLVESNGLKILNKIKLFFKKIIKLTPKLSIQDTRKRNAQNYSTETEQHVAAKKLKIPVF